MVKDDNFADLVLLDGKVVTLDSRNTIAEAVAIKDGKILAVGANSKVKSSIGSQTEMIELRGRTVVPGFQDTHTHVSGSYIYWFGVDLSSPPIKAIDEVLEKITQQISRKSKGEWVICYRYNNDMLAEKRHITLQELDQVAPDNPVLIIKGYGHVYVVNSKALELAGITRETPDPSGGEIERDLKTGEPTGVLYENAYSFIERVLPLPPHEVLKESIGKTIEMFARLGITTFTEANTSGDFVRIYQEMLQENKLMVRSLLLVSRQFLECLLKLGIRSGFGNCMLKIIGVKFFADGSGIGGTAAVYTPQHKGKKDLGIVATPPEELTNLVIKCHNAGLRVAIHAIGDRGIDIALDAIEAAQKQNPNLEMRHRIEHCSVCTPKQQNRIKLLGVVPSSSIGYMWNFGDDYIENFGPERVMWVHPHRSYVEKGIVATGNSDWPVSPVDPMKQIYCAVTRKTKSGQSFCEDQAVTVLDALRIYTINAAYAGCEEDIKGSIEPGKLADIVVLSDDILKVDVEEIKDIIVEMTIIGGHIVYRRKAKNNH